VVESTEAAASESVPTNPLSKSGATPGVGLPAEVMLGTPLEAKRGPPLETSPLAEPAVGAAVAPGALEALEADDALVAADVAVPTEPPCGDAAKFVPAESTGG
jgi:hypothetical protein